MRFPSKYTTAAHPPRFVVCGKKPMSPPHPFWFMTYLSHIVGLCKDWPAPTTGQDGSTKRPFEIFAAN